MVASGVSVGGCIRDDPIVGRIRRHKLQINGFNPRVQRR
jgi:hypothetical protein